MIFFFYLSIQYHINIIKELSEKVKVILSIAIIVLIFNYIFSIDIFFNCKTPRSGFGMDLAALNIQRGRDHGLAPYNIWREQCGLRRFREWEEMDRVIDKDTVSRLMNVYEHVDDVDLFTGHFNIIFFILIFF